MASNLPSNLSKHTAFRDKPYTHTITFPDGYPMPEEITGEIRRNRIIVPDVAPAISINGQSFTFTYSPEKLSKIQGLSDQYFLFDGKQMLGGSLNVMIGYGDPTTGSTQVVIEEGNITTVQVDGVEIVAGLVTQVQQDAAVVEASREQVVADAVQVSADRVIAQQEAGVAHVAADGAISAKNEAVTARTQAQSAAMATAADRVVVEGIREEMIEVNVRVSVPTRSAIDALLESGKPKLFEVAVDETLGDQELVPYRWNGSVLFMYDIYPSLTQPVI